MSSLSTIFIIAFWSCAGLIAFTYALYPPLVWCWSRLWGREPAARDVSDQDAPMISLLIVAHNEEAVMKQRLANALSMDYPRDRLEIVVASDGSSDRTTAIVREQGVRLIEFLEQRGKAAAINRAIPQLRGQIVILSDANTEFDSQAVRKLVRWFHDPKVGAVCGRLMLTDVQTGRNVDSVYWRYETMLKQSESRLGGLLGANGAVYAIRRSMFSPTPDGTIIEDFVIPLLARLRHGCSILYDIQAVAREESAPRVRDEFRRRCRIGTGNFQSFAVLWPLLNPRHGFVAFAFFSHKVLRWFCPFFLVGLLVSSLALVDHRFYRIALVAQLIFYAVASITLLIPNRLKLPKLLALSGMFVSMNAALLVGFVRWLSRSRHGSWSPTPRASILENKSG